MFDTSQLAKHGGAIFMALVFAFPMTANTQQASQPTLATLIEAHVFEPCDYNCMVGNNPRTEYCLDVEGTITTGERKGILWLGEDASKSLRSMTGTKLLYARLGSSFTIAVPTGRKISVQIPSKYEGFKDPRCRMQVHEFKLAEAKASNRPGSIPSEAFAVAGSQIGDYKPDFVWFACAKSKNNETIDCDKWYPDGKSKGIEHYCLSLKSGAEVTNLNFDYLASSEGNLILSSGDALQFDHRGRANEKLMNPNEVCH